MGPPPIQFSASSSRPPIGHMDEKRATRTSDPTRRRVAPRTPVVPRVSIQRAVEVMVVGFGGVKIPQEFCKYFSSLAGSHRHLGRLFLRSVRPRPLVRSTVRPASFVERGGHIPRLPLDLNKKSPKLQQRQRVRVRTG